MWERFWIPKLFGFDGWMCVCYADMCLVSHQVLTKWILDIQVIRGISIVTWLFILGSCIDVIVTFLNSCVPSANNDNLLRGHLTHLMW